MATKSILKDIKIKDKGQASAFMRGLGQAGTNRYEPVSLTRECREITGIKIKEFFGRDTC